MKTSTQPIPTATREALSQLKVGDELAQVYPTRYGVACPESRVGAFRKVTEIFARQDDVEGRLFVCCHTELTPGISTITASLKEGQQTYVIRKVSS